jgi:hypothetical protein
VKSDSKDKSNSNISTFQKISTFFVSGRMLSFSNKDAIVRDKKQKFESKLIEQSDTLKSMVQVHYKLQKNLESEFLDLIGSQQFSYMFKQVKSLETMERADKYMDFTFYKLALMESSEAFDEISEKRKRLNVSLEESLKDLKVMVEMIERISFSQNPNRKLTVDQIDFLSPDILLKLSNDEKLYFFKLNSAQKQLTSLIEEKTDFLKAMTILVANTYRDLFTKLRTSWKLAHKKNKKSIHKVTSGLEFRSRTFSILEHQLMNRKRTHSNKVKRESAKIIELVTDQDVSKFEINSDDSLSSLDESVRNTQITNNTVMIFRNSFGIKTTTNNVVNVDIPTFRVSEISNITRSNPKFKSFSNLSNFENSLHLPEINKNLVTSPKISDFSVNQRDLDFIPEQNPFVFGRDREDTGISKFEPDHIPLENSLFRNPQEIHSKNENLKFVSNSSTIKEDQLLLKNFDSFSSKCASQLGFNKDSEDIKIKINNESYHEEQALNISPSFSKNSDSIVSVSKYHPNKPNMFKKKKKVDDLSTSTLQDSDISGPGVNLLKKDPGEISNSDEQEFFTQYRNQFDSLFKFDNQETPRPSELKQNIFYQNETQKKNPDNISKPMIYKSEGLLLDFQNPKQGALPDQSFFEEFDDRKEGNYFTLAKESMKRNFGISKNFDIKERSSSIVRSKSNENKFINEENQFKIKKKKKRNSQIVIISKKDQLLPSLD